MGEQTKIGWTDHTFNPWLGCTKVSEACRNCYAEAWSKRSGLVKWGANAERRRTSDANWKQPLKWNKIAWLNGERKRVFCASLADVFEDRDELKPWRRDLFRLIGGCPDLDWLLLTKRPENAIRLMSEIYPRGFPSELSSRIAIGTTVESQSEIWRVRELVNARMLARTLFVSCEPLLGRVDLRNWIELLDWVIGGFESGANHRTGDTDAARFLRDQCLAAGVPFFWKQNGGRTAEAGGCLLDGVEYKQFPKAA